MIESTWRVVKQSLPNFGTTKEQYESYFEEFMFRRKYFEGREGCISLYTSTSVISQLVPYATHFLNWFFSEPFDSLI